MESLFANLKALFENQHPSTSQHTRKVAEQMIDNLDYPWEQFTLENFVRWLEAEFDTTLMLVPFRLPPTLFGALLQGARTRTMYVFYDCTLAPFHRQHVILHEIGHWLCKHKTVTVTPDMLEGDTVQWDRYQVQYRAMDPALPFEQREAEAEAVALTIQARIPTKDKVYSIPATPLQIFLQEFER